MLYCRQAAAKNKLCLAYQFPFVQSVQSFVSPRENLPGGQAAVETQEWFRLCSTLVAELCCAFEANACTTYQLEAAPNQGMCLDRGQL
jgi:hypothetical protein